MATGLVGESFAHANQALVLGSGLAGARGVAAKAALLDRARAAGLAVPEGIIVTPAADPTRLVLPDELGGNVAVRSAFGAEDRPDASLAGHFLTELDVPRDDVAASIDRVRASAGTHAAMRTDVLVMRCVDPVVAGVAFSEDGYEDDLVNATAGRGDRLLAGAEPGQAFRLARLRRFERPALALAPWQRRLSELLRAVRHEFGPGGWDVEWADDGRCCWLVQVRPVTAAPARNEAFTIANHKEILPELPSTFMTSLIESAAHDLLDFYASLDADLPVHRPFVETFAGRPYLNLSMLTDLMRALGLPTRLVTDSYGGTPDVDVGLRPRRMLAAAPTLARIGLAQSSAVTRANRVADELARTAISPDASFEDTIAVLRRSYLALVNEMGALASSLAPPVALLRATGTLDEHLARHRTAATRMLDDLEPLAAALDDRPELREDLGDTLSPASTPTTDADTSGNTDGSGRTDARGELVRRWHGWLEAHGHRGVFESDIARPRFADDPTPIVEVLRHGRHHTSPPGRRSLRAGATVPLWALVRAPMAAREQVRSAGMRAFAAIRTHLVALAAAAAAEGRLPAADDLWLLTIDEAVSLDAGADFTAADIEARRRERARLGEIRLPDTVHRFDDLSGRTDGGSTARSFAGMPLVRGRVEGRALRASEPPGRLPEGFDPATTVLVARSVDAGWIGTFTQVAGVAVEIGGDLSHGSIILRELGVVSVTNLGDLGNTIATGDPVRLDADTGRLVLLAPTPADQTNPNRRNPS
ncbi:MAG: PEP-utilizing enzyme [Acidimicrobiales bacterium]